MLAVGLKQAKKYDNYPILIAKCQNSEKNDIYYVEEGILPCQNCATSNPLELLTKKEIFQLKKKYKVSAKLLKQVEKCYANSDEKVDLGAECTSLSGRIFVEELETQIINKLKKQVRHKTADWLPNYDPELIRKFNQSTLLNGPSGCGKSHLAARIIEKCLPESTAWCFGPMITKDPAFRGLQKKMTKRRCKLIDAHKISVPIDISEISGNKVNVLLVDDPDAMEKDNLKWISDLSTKSLYHGRHLGIVNFQIVHDAFARRGSIKASTNECSRCILYPQIARHVCVKFMKNRLNMSKNVIERIFRFLKQSDRWMCLINHHPCCVLTNSGCMLL